MVAFQDWQSFYMLTGAAAATLIGLLFVSVTAGGYLPVTQAQNYLRTFVTPTLIYYAQVLIIACLVVMPLHDSRVLSLALLIIGCLNIYFSLKVLKRVQIYHSDDDDIEATYWIWHVALPFLSGVLFIVAAIGLFFIEPFELVALAIASADLLCLIVGIENSWVLIVWLVLRRGQSAAKSESATQKEGVQDV